MKRKYIYASFLMSAILPVNAQLLNISLRTNNQQLIDEAMTGAFVKISQAYELCDTVTDEHFGRNEKDYFNIVPFVGIETEQGMIFPTATLSPWTYDRDFVKYQEKYKPLVTESKISMLNCQDKAIRSIGKQLIGDRINEYTSLLNDTTQIVNGLKVDTISGDKRGWFIWLTSESNLTDIDSVKINSIKRNIEVPVNGMPMRIETPEISETIYGGVYVTPTQTGIGQVTFTLTGMMVLDEEGWILDFPFIRKPEASKTLTPIEKKVKKGKSNSLKKKRK